MDLAHHDLETKAGFAPDNPLQDAHVTHGELMRAFEAFKEANDERLASIERRSATCCSRRRSRASMPRSTPRPASRRTDAEIGAAPSRPRDGMRSASRASTRRRSTPMCAPAKARACARSKSRRCRSAPIRMAAIWCRSSSSTRSASGSRRSRRSARIAGVREIQRQRLQEAVHDHRPRDRLGRRDRVAHRQTNSPMLDALSFPAMELYAMPAATADAAGGLRGQHRRVDRRRGRAGLRGAGGHGLRHRRRHQQAEGLSRLHHGRQRVVGAGASSATSRPAMPAPSRTTDPSDVLVDLIYALKAGYRQNAHVRDEPQDAEPRSASSRIPTATISGSRRRGRRAAAPR